MIKIIYVCFVTLLMVVPFTASAEVQSSVGLKAWYNTWEQTVPNPSTNQKETVKSDSAVLMVGPAVNFMFDNSFFVGASYLVTTSDYEFTFKGVDPIAGNYTEVDSSDRKDLDLIGGFMFTPRIGVYVGYKTISSTSKYKYTTQNVGSGSGTFGEETLSGPGFGIMGNVPFGDSHVALYGSLGFLKLKDEFKDATTGVTDSINMSGATLEVGLSFIFAERMSANIGFKSQQVNGTDQGVEIENNFSGVTAGVNYTF